MTDVILDKSAGEMSIFFGTGLAQPAIRQNETIVTRITGTIRIDTRSDVIFVLPSHTAW